MQENIVVDYYIVKAQEKAGVANMLYNMPKVP